MTNVSDGVTRFLSTADLVNLALLLVLGVWFAVWVGVCGRGAFVAWEVRRRLREVQDGQLVDAAGPAAVRILAAMVYRLREADARHEERGLDNEVTALERALFQPVARVRAAAGILIVCGLLVTLINLRGAVTGMSDTFIAAPITSSAPGGSATSSRSALKVADPAEIQRSMQRVIAAAGTAFLSSAFAIGAATLLLFMAVIVSVWAERPCEKCRAWIRDVAYEARRRATNRTGPDVSQPLLESLTQLDRLTTTFEETSEALRDLRGFGDRMEGAADQIAEAVRALPSHIGDSVGRLGGEVTHAISQDLQHQLEYLKALVAIYGDQHMVLKSTVSAVTEAAQAARGVETSVGEVPTRLAAISGAVGQVGSVVAEVLRTVEVARRKVEDFPTTETREAIVALNSAAQGLLSMRADFEAIASNLTQLSTSAEIKNAVTAEIKRAEAALDAAITAICRGQAADGATIRDGLALLLRCAEERRSTAAASTDGEAQRVVQSLHALHAKLDSLPWMRLRGVWGRRTEG